jgi:hypothetical protein
VTKYAVLETEKLEKMKKRALIKNKTLTMQHN